MGAPAFHAWPRGAGPKAPASRRIRLARQVCRRYGGRHIDRVEIEALRGEFTDAIVMCDYGRFASLFTEVGAWRIPYINVELIGRDEIRGGIERMQGLWDYFIQTTHPGTIQLEGDTAVGRAHVSEFGQMRNNRSELNYALYHDRYERTPNGWRFAERIYELKYLDTTSLSGSPLASDHPRPA
jgi:hypothetical protein